jgi:dihydrofolate reductase
MTAPSRRIACLAVSADGLIADRHGQIGWLEKFGAAEDFGFGEFLASVDALVMGRRTFDQVSGFGGAWPYGSRPTLVLTHRPAPARRAMTS